MEEKAGLLYADDECLIANSEEDLNVIMENVNECVVCNKVNEHTGPKYVLFINQ